MSCPPQLSSDDRGDEAQETSATDISPGSRPIRDQYLGHVIALDQSEPSTTDISPVKSSCEMLRGGVDMSELVRKLSGQRQTATDSSETGHDDEDEENDEVRGNILMKYRRKMGFEQKIS